MNSPRYPLGAVERVQPIQTAKQAYDAAEAPRKMTVTDELVKDANGNAERIMYAARRLREFNERMFGIQPKSEDDPGTPVTGMLSALGYQLSIQRSFLTVLEEQLTIAEGI